MRDSFRGLFVRFVECRKNWGKIAGFRGFRIQSTDLWRVFVFWRAAGGCEIGKERGRKVSGGRANGQMTKLPASDVSTAHSRRERRATFPAFPEEPPMSRSTKAADPTPQPSSSAEPVPDDPDEYNDRIRRTGCFEENEALQLCYYDRKDWRACSAEMQRFRECWKRHEKKSKHNGWWCCSLAWVPSQPNANLWTLGFAYIKRTDDCHHCWSWISATFWLACKSCSLSNQIAR